MKNLEGKLYDIAKEVLIKRYPKGWGGVTLALTENENVLMGLYLDGYNSKIKECIEKSVINTANKSNEKITHLLIMIRKNRNSNIELFIPCAECRRELKKGRDILPKYLMEENGRIYYKEL